MNKAKMMGVGVLALVGSSLACADEVVVRSIDLPGASMYQEVTYSPDRRTYESTRDAILVHLEKGDDTARVNPVDGPWMLVETTAEIGLAVKGVGTFSGRKHLRRVSAAEEALYRFERGR